MKIFRFHLIWKSYSVIQTWKNINTFLKKSSLKRVFLISVCRAKFGESRNLEKMIGTPPLDDQMNISLQKNVLNSLQPPKTASTGPKFCCSQKDSFLKGSFRCSPNHIQHWNMECHTPLERSRIAFYGYVNFWSPNQTIWWPGAIEGFWRL